jgi:hypothetical protein
MFKRFIAEWLWILGLFLSLAGSVFAYERPLSELAPGLAIDGTISVPETPRFVGDRIVATVVLSAPSLFADLDRIGQSKGNMGGCNSRLFWVGPTRLNGVPSTGAIRVTSRARYEQWTCVDLLFDKLKTELFRDTKTIDLSLRPVWDQASQSLTLLYSLDNIRNFPGEFEQQLRRLGVEFGGQTRVSVASSATFAALDPQIARWAPRAINDNAGLALDIELSLNRTAVMGEISEQLGLQELVPDLVGGALSLVGWRS